MWTIYASADSCVVVVCLNNCCDNCFHCHPQDFLGKRSQLKAKPGATVLLFSYAGNGLASERLSIRVARWKSRPKRIVTVAATVKIGAAHVTLSLDASHRLVATIVSGGNATTLMKGMKEVGSATVTIVPGALSWAASCTIKTPTLTVAAQQVCSLMRATSRVSAYWPFAPCHQTYV